MASLLPNAKTQFLDANGRPLVGGKVFFYFVGTETKKDTFQDPALSIPNTNPVILDAYGEASIWGTGAYRQVLKNSYDVQIWDQVTQESGAALAGDFKEEMFVAGDGIADHTFIPGTTSTLTLTNSFGGVQNIDVHFDAAYQGPDQILSLQGKTLTFTSPIPVGVSTVYVKGGLAVPMAVPADNSVTADKIANGAVSTKLANEAINQPGTGQFWTQNGALIQRLNDRVFLGGMTQSDGKYPPATLDWFSQYEASVGYTNPTLSGVFCVSTTPAVAAAESVASTFAAQSLTSTNAGASCIPVEAFAINNNSTYATSAWAFYGEAHKTTSQAGSVYGMELDVLTLFDGGTPTPFQQGTSVGVQLGAGAGVKGATFRGFISGTTLTIASGYAANPGYTPLPGDSVLGAGVTPGTIITAVVTAGTYTVNNSQTITTRELITASQKDASAAIQIVNNPTRWGVGINFLSTSIIGCDGTNGQGIAISMAKGHTIQWYTPNGNPGPSVLSTVSDSTKLTGIDFTDSGAQIFGPGAATLAMFAPTANASNYFQFNAAPSGSAIELIAAGIDANINLKLTPKGSGSVQLGAAYTAGVVSQAGYVTMLDASGTPRRFLIG
jgi:hypothetical protein